MFESRQRSGGGSSANRWLLVAGAGLVILAFVARMLLDIGHTKVSDLAGVLRPDTASAAPVPVPVDSAATATVPDTQAAAPDTVPGTVVAASPPPVLKNDTATPSPPPSPAVSAGGYVIQIGAFGSEVNAEKLGKRAAALGYQAAVLPQARGASTLYLVRVTGAGSAAAARQASDSLAHSLGVKAVIIRSDR